jgi:hypothetical protein
LQVPVHASWAVVRPGVVPKRPAGHPVHAGAPPRLNCPAGHRAAVADVDPATHAYPAVQYPVHRAEARPVVAPYVPAGHLVHAAALAVLYCPTGHTVGDPVPPEHWEPAGQAAHAAAPPGP